MFQTLETTWDKSARRGWTTLASFTMQALALSLLLAVPFVWLEGPPSIHWIDSSIFSPPPGSPPPQQPTAQRHPLRGSPVSGDQIVQPSSIPQVITPIIDAGAPAAPAIGDAVVPGGIGNARRGVPGGLGELSVSVAPPPPVPVPSHPLRVSHWAEGNIVHQVQPKYPPLAQAARVQGTVQLRAIVSKTGTIEHLTVVGGPAMLITAAVEAVKQWRYRPYMLNGEPIEVDTEITVNFVLAGR